jgi:hypothetical protein
MAQSSAGRRYSKLLQTHNRDRDNAAWRGAALKSTFALPPIYDHEFCDGALPEVLNPAASIGTQIYPIRHKLCQSCEPQQNRTTRFLQWSMLVWGCMELIVAKIDDLQSHTKTIEKAIRACHHENEVSRQLWTGAALGWTARANR